MAEKKKNTDGLAVGRKKTKIYSSPKMQRFAKILSEDRRVSKYQAAIKAGYSPSTATKPNQITNSRSWEELMAIYLPEEKISRVHSELLDAERPVVVDRKIHMFPDNDARYRAVDAGYKLRGKYAAEQINITRRKYAEMTNEELMAARKKAESFLRKK